MSHYSEGAKAKAKARYLSNRDKRLAYMKAYREAHREEREAHREERNAKERAKRAANPGLYSKHSRKWQKANPEKARSWAKRNKDKMAAYKKNWDKENAERRNQMRKARYRARQMGRVPTDASPIRLRDDRLKREFRKKADRYRAASAKKTECSSNPMG
jgi:hypothetical protein